MRANASRYRAWEYEIERALFHRLFEFPLSQQGDPMRPYRQASAACL